MKLYSGRFNYHGELHNLHTKANSEPKAFNNFITQLSKKLGQGRRSLLFYFLDEQVDNWKVREGYFDKHE